jgi:ubiquinone/menaquinone biosynthesis C-methylase UbiE
MAEATESLANTNPLEEYRYSYWNGNIQTETLSDTVAKAREKMAPFRFKLAARQISKELQLSHGDKVLELGSGLGLLGKAIKEEVDGEVKYFGIELAYQSAEVSGEQGLLESQANVLNLPFADNAFDALVTTDVLEHIKDNDRAISEMLRVIKPGGKAFVVIADPSEARFKEIHDHIDRTSNKSDIKYWENLFNKKGLKVLSKDSEKYRKRDWRKMFNLPFLVKLKDKPGFACAFNPVNRPGTYILEKH